MYYIMDPLQMLIKLSVSDTAFSPQTQKGFLGLFFIFFHIKDCIKNIICD